MFTLLKEKDRTVESLSEQITRYKCESISQAKIISNLQEKINKLQPNTNNTASNFMMASEFKDSFENFMKSDLTMALAPILDYPKLYAKVTQQTLNAHYEYVGQKLGGILKNISQILNVKDQE